MIVLKRSIKRKKWRSKHIDRINFHCKGFNDTIGSICQGETNKEWNEVFDEQFKEENLINCKKFCNCKRECKGFTFNPNSKKRKCSWKTDFPIEMLSNEGIVKSGQSCVTKGNKDVL